MQRNNLVAAFFVVLFACLPCASIPRASAQGGTPDIKALTAEGLQRWGQAEVILVAELTNVTKGPVGLSFPPLFTHKLDLNVQEALRGPELGGKLTVNHVIKQEKEPTFPQGKKCLVGLTRVKGNWQAHIVAEASEAEIAQARIVALVPLGWTLTEGKLASPWAKLGDKGWPADDKTKGVRCAHTGRPALLAGNGVSLTVEPVKPKVELKFKNPDGDGEYKITVANVTTQPVTVPALLTDGKKILWDESLAIICQKKVYPIPGAAGVKEKPQPVELKPGEAVSTVVNVFKLQGPEWPKGGYRIEFLFCLGEKSVTHSFYYYSAHHDPIRAQATAKEAGTP